MVASPKHQIIETDDEVCLDGAVIHHETFVYYMMHKPQDVLSATQDRRDTVVLDLLHDRDKRKGLFPVGLLDDKDTTGLLLLTDNGPLAHAMLSPKKHVAKVYEAHVQGVMAKEDISAFQEGIALSDHKCQPAALTIIHVDHEAETSLVHITVEEGKYHQVKQRMVASCGKRVTRLKRLSMGDLVLDDRLAAGDYRPLTADEIGGLKQYGVEI